jgi:hypothetical protein
MMLLPAGLLPSLLAVQAAVSLRAPQVAASFACVLPAAQLASAQASPVVDTCSIRPKFEVISIVKVPGTGVDG